MDETERNEFLSRQQALLRWAANQAAAMAPGLDPDDAMQEIALLVVRRFGSYKPENAFSGWVHYLARAVADQYRKRAGKAAARTVRYEEFWEATADDAEPLEELERADELAIMRWKLDVALANLRPSYREAVVRRFGLDGHEPEGADAIRGDVSRTAVYNRVRRALTEMGRIIKSLEKLP